MPKFKFTIKMTQSFSVQEYKNVAQELMNCVSPILYNIYVTLNNF